MGLFSVHALVRKVKGRSSHRVQREFPEICRRYWGCRLWGRGYFSTANGAISEDIVLQFWVPVGRHKQIAVGAVGFSGQVSVSET